MTNERRTVRLSAPSEGWMHPWPNAFELARDFPTSKWTLVGGVMVQAHAIAHGIPVSRPTDDLDLLLHIEVDQTVAGEAHDRITSLGYRLREPSDPRRRNSPHYRYERPSPLGTEKIDVMAAEHAAPRTQQTLSGRPMFEIEGGTQALRRTMIYEIETNGELLLLSVPDELGALVLKGAAHIADNRDADRHLQDAAVLAACISDHAAELERLVGSDRQRIGHLAKELADPRHPAWLALSRENQLTGQDTLRILSNRQV
jgi:hypothetical protein